MYIVFGIILLLLLAGFGIAVYLLYHHFKRRLKRETIRTQKSEQLKAVFLDNASHALRTPLNAILGYSNMIIEEDSKGALPRQVREMANHIKTDSQKLLDYVKQLTELSSYEGGMLSFTYIEVNLAELMASYRREALNLTKPEVSVRLRTDLSPHCKVTLDTNFMHQLMMHILNNAAKHAAEDDISIYYGSERKGLKVTVTYKGNGQAELLSEDLFSYLQHENVLPLSDTVSDLGLPICKAIIDAVGGELDMDVVNGTKTVTTMWFPCKMKDKHKGI